MAAKTTRDFPALTLVKADQIFGAGAQHAHLDEGGILDHLSAAR